jgi:beta-glucanase (GH16 family)
MKKRISLVVLLSLATVFASLQLPASGATVTKKLIWRQEFNGKALIKPNAAIWNYDLGGMNANSEEQLYTNSKYNAATDGKGNLIITAKPIIEGSAQWEKCISCKFSSARIKTQGKVGFRYGRMEARIKMPAGQGTWPAFWMLGANLEKVGWPESGELDIVEARGGDPLIVFGTAHGPGYNGSEGTQIGNTIFATRPLSEDYHVYAIEWTKNSVNWYFDNQLYHRLTPSSTSPNSYVFNREFFLILNLAMGGSFTGDIDPNLKSARMYVDYIRYYQLNGVGAVIKHKSA